ncbi:hypothetical protein A7K95_04365 [Pediococcus parvulus]|uniref:Mucin binding domain-containing protein n=4 Tax=Lactobacillaceae TaxID=33958 RepID=A0AAP5TAL6_9LACO|nr:KxYKxGKxW signal peptide domain-containing protein [Pediococcus parvulus]MDV7693722.1 hypothetical protein [Pediococcus parvulus]OAD64574.1 hypothetical protein A7K95_04365 [Pediococcus parvulus]
MKKSNYSKLNWSLQRDLAERKEHFKMFKAGRTWLFAGVTVLFFGSGIFFNQISIQADTSSESSSVVAKTSTVSKDSTQTTSKAASSSSIAEQSTSADKVKTSDSVNNRKEVQNTVTQSVSSSNNSESIGQSSAAIVVASKDKNLATNKLASSSSTESTVANRDLKKEDSTTSPTSEASKVAVSSTATSSLATNENERNASLTISYVDDDNAENVITTKKINGQVGDTNTYNVANDLSWTNIMSEVNSSKKKYVLATGQSGTVKYTLTADDSDNLLIHLQLANQTYQIQYVDQTTGKVINSSDSKLSVDGKPGSTINTTADYGLTLILKATNATNYLARPTADAPQTITLSPVSDVISLPVDTIINATI